jgi:integrase
MPRSSCGSILVRTLSDGTRSYRLRFRAYGERHDVFLHERAACRCGCGGGWDERGARTELGNIQARVRVGVWRPAVAPILEQEAPAEMPSFHEYASSWLQSKLDGTIGEKPLAANTEAAYRGMLKCHLLPFFASYKLDEIDPRLCLAYKAQKVREAAEVREALSAGADLRDRRGRRQVPLSPSSIRKTIGLLGMILEEAQADELITQNPARGKRMRIRVPRPRRTFLEIDELVALIEAAAEQDALPAIAASELAGDGTRAQVARRLSAGRRASSIAAELGISTATVSYHAAQLIGQARPYVGRRIVIEILGRCGVRASELCDLRIRDVRLHDAEGARFQVRDSKTDAGIREVQMTPHLVEAFVDHLDRLRRSGRQAEPEDFAVPNLHGGRMSRQRARAIVRDACVLATERREAVGLPPLPPITPHSLRRTYISLALLANSFDVKWVMSQVGHADSKMTLDVYAQLEQRVQRDHGRSFDKLLADVRGQASLSAVGSVDDAGGEDRLTAIGAPLLRTEQRHDPVGDRA